MATITGNYVDADPTQWWTLDYTFADSKFTWSVTAHASHTSYWNSIYGLTVNVGGNSYYKGDIAWGNYTPNTVVYSGTTNLSDCTISNGSVTLSVTGNFYYGTWNTAYTSTGSGTCAVASPTVTALTYTATNKYSSSIVAGRSVITFTMKGTSASGSTSMTYALYQGSSVIATKTGTSGTAVTQTYTAPSAGTYSFKYVATDGNGLSTTSGTISITTVAYTAPSFTSVKSVRWTTGTSSGSASDTGTYAQCTPTFTAGKVGTTTLTTTCKVTVSSYSGTTTTSGTALYLGNGALSADNTYTVTYSLYDSYIGSSNAIVRTDTLTIGGRGLDLIYSSGKYGIGVGTKAVAGNLMTAYPINGVEYGNTALPDANAYLTGGTLTSAVNKLYNGTVSASSGSTAGYLDIATITITGTYANFPLIFELVGRGTMPVRISILFQSTNSNDPGLMDFLVEGNRHQEKNVRLIKTATSTWELVMDNYSTYQRTKLIKVVSDYNYSAVSIVTHMTNLTTLPSGTAYLATGGDPVGSYYPTSALLIGTWKSGNINSYIGTSGIRYPVYRRMVKGTSTKGTYTISTSGWNVYRILDVRMWTTNSGNSDHAIAPYYMSSADYFNWYVPSENTSIVLRSGTSYAFGAFEMFVDYAATAWV